MIETEGRRIADIHRDLVRELGDMIDEYFHVASWPSNMPDDPGFRLHGTDTWPTVDCRWVACYAVTGGSEGWYWHVDVIRNDQSRDMVFLGKTFISMEHAQNCAAKCAELLGA